MYLKNQSGVMEQGKLQDNCSVSNWTFVVNLNEF